tara:strand:- start:7647 stop:8789 length:1143 start_codon:yes stop_codon:yes gene_type:complete
MILHIVDDEKFLLTTITTFETIFPNENCFLVGVEGTSYNRLEDLKSLAHIEYRNTRTKEYNQKFLELVKGASLLIFHNIYKTYKLELINNFKGNIKIAWIFWGAELYGLNPKFNALLPITQKAYLKSLPLSTRLKKCGPSKLKNRYYWGLLKRALNNKIDYILTNLEEDIALLEYYTKTSSKRKWFTYYNFNENNIISNRIIDKKHILIGNSSSETNNHFDTFELLLNKNLSDKKLYIPLNYGDKKYGGLVIAKAKSLFGESAKPIVNFLALEEYSRIIGSCAVLIMNHKRQQAFNTIMIALAQGCKVYLREENSIFGALNNEGFIIFSIQKDIDKESAFLPLSIQNQIHNLNLIKEKYSGKTVLAKIKTQMQHILEDEY